jgi:outer membrane protein TolC
VARGFILPGRPEITKWLPRPAGQRLKFDECGQNPQNRRTMKVFSFVLCLFLAAYAAAAQTETNAPTAAGTDPAQAAARDALLQKMAGTNAPITQATNATGQRAMSLQDCIAEALQHNLDLQIQRYNPQISLYNLKGTYGGYDPTFNFSGTHTYNDSGASFQNGQRVTGQTINEDSFSSGFNGTLPWGTIYNLGGNVSSAKGDQFGTISNNLIHVPLQSSSGQVGALTLTQPLLKNFWIDQTRLNVRVAKNRLQYSEQGVREQLITSVTAVENAYYELIYAQENVKVQQEALVLAQTQLDQDQQRVQIGTLAQLDVQQDEAQAATSKANLIAAQNTLSVDENALKNVLTDNYAQWHDTLIQPTETLTATMQLFDLQDSWNKGMTERPDLLQARLNVEQQGIQLKFDYNQLYPSLDLVGSYGYNGSGQNFDGTFDQFNQANQPFWSYGAQFSMPLSNVGARNNYKAGKVTLKQLLLQLKQMEQSVMVDIDNAVKQAQSSYQSVQATQQARTYAEAALDAEQKKYAVGKSTTFTVLQLQKNLTSARSDEIRALADYNEALANLAAKEGSTLERNNINIELK